MKSGRLVFALILLAVSTMALAQGGAGKTNVPLTSTDVASGDPALEPLEGLRRSVMAAWQRKDSAALRGIMASDFLFVSPAGVASRDQWLQGVAHCSLDSYTMEDVKLHAVSADSAAVIYKLHYVGACDGKASPSDAMVVDTFQRRAGRWWIVVTAFMPQP